MSEHFIGIERLLEIIRLVREKDEPLDIIAELQSEGMEKEELQKKEKGGKNNWSGKGHGKR